MNSGTRPERDLNSELSDFIDYVFSFYGKNGIFFVERYENGEF